MTAPSLEGPASPVLGPLVRRVLVGVFFSSVGSGLTLPFLFVYLTQVRHLPTALIGLLFAWMGVLALALTAPVGTIIDRAGPRVALIGGLTIQAVGVAAYAWVSTMLGAFLVSTVITFGSTTLWPAGQALLTRMVDEPQRERVYGFDFMLMNAGLGVGGLIASVLVSIDSVTSFQRLYLIDAVTYLAHIGVVLSLPRMTGKMVKEPSGEDVSAPEPGWREVMRDRTLVRLVAITILLLTFGYAQAEVGFTAYATTVADIEPRYLGWAFAANTGAIVAGQLLTLRLIQGRSRTRLLALAAAIWATAWGVIGLGGAVPGWWAVAMVVAGLGVFGLGETLWAPVAPAIVNALAREEVRGRYNAFSMMAWAVSGILGPALAGLLFGAGLPGVWLGMTIGGSALAGLLLLGLGKHLTPEQNGLVTD